MKFLKILLVGIGISFLGSIPPGTLNVATMQISITEGYEAALWFAAGCIVPEIIYVRLSLLAVNTITKQRKILQAMDWIVVVILLALALSSFIAMASTRTEVKSIFLFDTVHPFLLALLMSSVNPAQFPFWLGWNTILLNKKFLPPLPNYFNVYIAGIAAGSFAGSLVFIFGGRMIADHLHKQAWILQGIIGIFFTLAAIMQLGKLMLHKNAAQRIGSNT